MTECKLLGRSVLCGTAEELTTAVLELGPAHSAFFCNVHMLMLSREDPMLAQAMDRATMILPDGVPIAWLQRRLGCEIAKVLRGYEAVEALCSAAAATGEPVGFYGSSKTVLDALVEQLQRRYVGLNVTFAFAPPEFPTSKIQVDAHLVQTINSHNLRCLFVGLGCPKQEIWIDHYSRQLNCALFGVGAAFDWLAGTTRKPPNMIENTGLAWLFRLVQNPRRLWRRYLVYNSKFLIYAIKLLAYESSNTRYLGRRR